MDNNIDEEEPHRTLHTWQSTITSSKEAGASVAIAFPNWSLRTRSKIFDSEVKDVLELAQSIRLLQQK